MQLPAWQATNQAALVAALRPVYAALCRVAGRDSPEEEPAPDPAAADSTSALDVLCALFGLTAFERDLLLLCAGVELEGRFAEICALAHRDSKRTSPTFGLALAALPGAHWSALTRDRPLRHWRMLEVLPGETLAGSPLRIDERILHCLAGVECVDERLEGIVFPLAGPAALPSWLTDAAQAGARAVQAGEHVALTGRSASRRTRRSRAAIRRGWLPPSWRAFAAPSRSTPVKREGRTA